jgi:hypothetical protein
LDREWLFQPDHLEFAILLLVAMVAGTTAFSHPEVARLLGSKSVSFNLTAVGKSSGKNRLADSATKSVTNNEKNCPPFRFIMSSEWPLHKLPPAPDELLDNTNLKVWSE